MLARAGADDVARDHERLGRAGDGLADGDEPAGVLRLDAGQARPLELDAHHLRAVLARHGRALDGLALVVAEHADVEHGFGVEHQPERIGALEHRRRRRLREREEQPHVVALAAKLGDRPDGSDRAGAASGRGGRRSRLHRDSRRIGLLSRGASA